MHSCKVMALFLGTKRQRLHLISFCPRHLRRRNKVIINFVGNCLSYQVQIQHETPRIFIIRSEMTLIIYFRLAASCDHVHVWMSHRQLSQFAAFGGAVSTLSQFLDNRTANLENVCSLGHRHLILLLVLQMTLIYMSPVNVVSQTRIVAFSRKVLDNWVSNVKIVITVVWNTSWS